MSRFDGSLARQLDFGSTTTMSVRSPAGSRPGLRLAAPRRLSGPDKYTVLEHRRRQAQITARRLLDLLDLAEER